MLLKEKIREDNVNREAITEERGCKLRFKGWIRLYSVKLLGASWDDSRDWEWLKGWGLESFRDIFTHMSGRWYGLLAET